MFLFFRCMSWVVVQDDGPQAGFEGQGCRCRGWCRMGQAFIWVVMQDDEPQEASCNGWG